LTGAAGRQPAPELVCQGGKLLAGVLTATIRVEDYGTSGATLPAGGGGPAGSAHCCCGATRGNRKQGSRSYPSTPANSPVATYLQRLTE
jgi:hypothetical protein